MTDLACSHIDGARVYAVSAMQDAIIRLDAMTGAHQPQAILRIAGSGQ